MARIFLSHSSANNAAAVALRDWLRAEGWDDVFLDLDPDRGIAPGERWERALNEAADRCEAVVFLVGAAWLASDWCRRELTLALRLNKRLFAVLIEDLPLSALPAEVSGAWQVVRLAAGSDHQMFRVVVPPGDVESHVTFSRDGLGRLRNGLRKAGLDPGFFVWPPAHDPDRSPYRGLRPLDAEDAGVFFGREAPKIAALDRLRGLRDGGAACFFVILGASGAGKSSFLRAGLLPNLARDDRNFAPLPPVRPDRAALSGETGLVRAIVDAFAAAGAPRSRADVRKALDAGVEQSAALLADLVRRRTPPPTSDEPATKQPTLIVPLDQGEELFAPDKDAKEEADALLRLLRALAERRDPEIIVVVTIRSDRYEALQTARELKGFRQETFSLGPMPRGAYQLVIEGPARRLAESRRPLRIEAAVTQALLLDVDATGATDALPLLAFTLERLYLEHGGDGDLTLAEYQELDGVQGSIEAAVGRAMKSADRDSRVPADPTAREALLRRAMIPWLAGIDPQTRAPRRRVARYSEIPEEARPLVEHLVDARLLATDFDEKSKERTIEPAHEALLRQWGLLKGWLIDDFALLSTLEGVLRATIDWLANERSPELLVHAAGRLRDADALQRRTDLASFLKDEERAYLAACRAAEDARRERELADARRLADEQARAAEAQAQVIAEQARVAEEQKRVLAEQARTLMEQEKAAAADQLAARRTRIGLAAALVLALIAGAAAWFGYWQWGEAEKQNTEARKRSALLAEKVARNLATDGATDEALLVLADAAGEFADRTAPDQMLASLVHALERAKGRTAYPLGREMLVVEADRGAYLLDTSSGQVWRFDGTMPLRPVFKDAPDDSAIIAFPRRAGGDGLVVVRANLSIESITDAGVRTTIGRFEPPPEFLRTHSLDVDRLGNVLWTFEVGARGSSETKLRVFHRASGSVSNDRAMSGGAAVVERPGKSPVILDLGVSLANIDAQHGRFAIADAGDQDRVALDEVRGLHCLEADAPPDDPRRKFVAAMYDAGGFPLGPAVCRSGAGVLLMSLRVTSGMGASVGQRSRAMFADGETKDLRSHLEEIGALDLSRDHRISWFGVLPPTDDPNQSLAVAIVNRDVVVFDGGSLRLQRRHPFNPQIVLPVDARTIAVVGGSHIVFHVLPDAFRSAEAPSREIAIAPEARGPQPLNRGSCAGYHGEMSLLYRADHKTTFEVPRRNSEAFDSPGPKHLRVVGPQGERRIPLPDRTECVQFSSDWRRLLLVTDREVRVFDVARIVDAGSIEAALSAPPIKQVADSAFFVPGTWDVVTASGAKVTRWTKPNGGQAWSQSILYSGDHVVRYAEPDSSGTRLLLGEQISEGWYRASLYSVAAKEPILVADARIYKWLGLSLLPGDKSFAMVGPGLGAWREHDIPTLPALVHEALSALSPACHPPRRDQPRTSPCWPSTDRAPDSVRR